MIRPIAIVAVSNGWIVTVGCQQVVFTSVASLTSLLQQYLTNPEETEKTFTETAVNVKHTMGSGGLDLGGTAPNGVPPQWFTVR